MSQYIIMTDSSCDLPAQLAAELELEVLPLSVLIDGKSYVNYLDERDISFADCYAALRAGKSATTSAVNVEAFVEAMERHLQAGFPPRSAARTMQAPSRRSSWPKSTRSASCTRSTR